MAVIGDLMTFVQFPPDDRRQLIQAIWPHFSQGRHDDDIQGLLDTLSALAHCDWEDTLDFLGGERRHFRQRHQREELPLPAHHNIQPEQAAGIQESSSEETTSSLS